MGINAGMAGRETGNGEMQAGSSACQYRDGHGDVVCSARARFSTLAEREGVSKQTWPKKMGVWGALCLGLSV